MSAATPFATTEARAGESASPTNESVRFSSADSLVEVDASLPLALIARRCRESGWLFPLPRPLPPLSLAAACARMPFLVDAYLASAEAVTSGGLPFGTGRAPRAATGPDLLGALCSSPPLATCLRGRVRVLDEKSARQSVERFTDVVGALGRLLALLEEGRAFAALVAPVDGGYRVRALGGPASLPDGEPASSRVFGEGALGRVTSACSLAPGDEAAMREALEAGRALVAAPFMGRVAALLDDEAAPLGDGGADAFAAALVRAGGRDG